ncbi:MAG: nucleoside triphosphate pyrophosphohydrolase, partial [Acidobacteria bacterium]
PWDREQTVRSLRPFVLEEAHEVAAAIDTGDPEQLRGELGDLLLQVVFLAQLAREQGLFTFEDVARGIADKLVRRHPHVFGDATAGSVDEVWQRWDAIKRRERSEAGDEGSRLDGVPRALPALVRARLLGDKAARAGFDWRSPEDVLVKVREELAELEQTIGRDAPDRVDEEFGDLLFALASLGRHLGLDPEGSLARACDKFSARFRDVERRARERGQALEELDDETLDALWNAASGRPTGAGDD